MYSVKTLNAISDIIYEALAPTAFAVSAEAAAPDAVIVRSADMLGAELNDNLLAVARAGVGYNNVPVDRCSEKGVVVFNTPGANANAVKELAVLGMLLASRPVLEAALWAQSLKGKGAEVPALVEKGKGQFVGPELKGKVMGLIGLGAIGGPVANMAQSLGMTVYGFDPTISVEHAWALSRAIRRVSSEDELLESADYLSLHIPLVSAPASSPTRGKVNAAFLSKLKKGAVLLNFSRGELAVDEDIIAALSTGQLRAYVTDFPNDTLLGVEGVIAIPHLGASTPESEENCAQMAAEQLRDYLLTGSIHNSVNLPECVLAPPTQCRVAIIHKNVPGSISAITNVMGNAGINISNMINKSLKDMAYTVLDLDDSATDAVVERLRATDYVLRVRVI